MKEEDGWECLSDTPQEFEQAIKNAISENERVFFETFRYKVLNETAFSNDVLMDNLDNEDGLYILRVRVDDVMIGRRTPDDMEVGAPVEFEGIFAVVDEDLFEWIGRHVTLLQWLRERDFSGIRYDANNDYR